MLVAESLWIRDVLAKTDLSRVRTVLDVGSSTLKFRTECEPYIEGNVFGPLTAQCKTIFHLDQRANDGVDVVCHVNRLETINQKYDLVICTNLLQHLIRPGDTADKLVNLIVNDGYLLVTVPNQNVYRADPIDTMYRPSLDELLKLFPSMKCLQQSIVTDRRVLLRKRFESIQDAWRYEISIRFKKATVQALLPFKSSCLLLQKVRNDT